MKMRVFLGLFGMGAAALAGSARAADAPMVIDLDKPEPPAQTAPKKDEKKKPEAPKEEAMGKVEGIEIKRGAGYMGVAVVGGNFKLVFYDAKRKPVVVPAEVARAVLRWSVNYSQKDERAILNPSGDGKALTSTKVVRPPLVFRLSIILQAANATEDGANESYSVDFRG